MGKRKLSNYVFHPGVSRTSNAYPNAYNLISNNKDFIIAEAVAYINARITSDNAQNLKPNAVNRLTNNRTFIIDEIIAWIAAQVAGGGPIWGGYTYSVASCRRDTGYLIDALIYDVRYGGNESTLEIARNFWQGGVAQLISPTQEILGFQQVFNIITNYVLPGVSYVSQQSPVTSTQSLSGANAEAGVATNIDTNLKPIIINVISGGLSTLPPTVSSVYNYAGYDYDSSKCYRDIGLVIDAYLHDLRYGGNYRTRYISQRFWNGERSQLSGDRLPEITAQTFIRNLINNNILTKTLYTTEQSPVTEFQNTTGTSAEAGASARITTLSNSFISVLTNGLSSVPALSYGVTVVRLLGKYNLEDILLITNASNNQIIYNFSDPTAGGVSDVSNGYVSNDFYYDEDFGAFRDTADYVSTLYLDADTSSCADTDDIQVFVEGAETKVRPYDFGTDAIERHRVATPESMLDADFEYGLQPTKWAAIGLSRGYPSVYEVPGTDTSVVNVVTDASTGTAGVGASLITVTTVGPHGFTVGTPITIKALANTVTGFSRAEGTFVIASVPTTTTFTYYAISKVGTNNGDVLATAYTQLRKGAFYTGANVGTPNFAVFSNGSSGSFTSVYITASGSDKIAFSGSVPSLGAPLTASGIPSGTQVSGIVGSGGIATTKTVSVSATIGANNFIVNDASGILEGMAIDNGTGTAIFVNSLAGTQVNLSGSLTAALNGDTQTYNVSGTTLAPAGTSATFDVTRLNNAYQSVAVNTGGSGYRIGDQVVILGTSLGGATPTNDLTITVTGVGGTGDITTVSFSGTSATITYSYNNVLQDATSGAGINTVWNVVVEDANPDGTYTVSLVNGGSGFAPSDTITILGTNLGGSTPANDLTITVSTVGGLGQVLTFSSSGTSTGTDGGYSNVSGTNAANSGASAIFTISRSAGSYTLDSVGAGGTGYRVGNRITILGTNLSGTSPTNDLILQVSSISGDAVTAATTISGTAVLGSTVDFYSTISMNAVTTASIAASTSISFAAIATIQVTTATAHGLVPGASITTTIGSSGTNHQYAAGPFFVESVPTTTTFRYTARTAGAIDTTIGLSGTLYTKSDAYFIHRPYDGGVQLGAGGPSHGAQAIRMSKKYIRYQSGKGVNYCTGALFAPSVNLQSATATGTTIGSYITFVTDDTDHGVQVGATVKIAGIDTFGYNGTYQVSSITNERTFRVQATTVLENVTATITAGAIMSTLGWHGATVRAGTFDDQNGLFFQYDGQYFSVVRRTATEQLAGICAITRETNLITGTNTRFRDQLQAGDRIVIKGMTHTVTQVISQTSMTVAPDYRGANSATSAKICKVTDFVINQPDFNIDRLDGTGPSGFVFDPTKMQMIGMQWSWYAVGFIDFMLRGSDGNFIFFHRIRNSNINIEAYMRTGNQAVRYEVHNESARSKLRSSISAAATTLPLEDASQFPNESGVVYIDNELIAFTGKSGNNLTGCSRATSLVNFVAGATRTFTAGPAATHEYNTGVILISNTTSPIISHWGSAFLMDGQFDEDRGYIFSYASTGLSVTTTKQTAFLIRLAPSVSNAIVGDLGERELLNRAQLLLQGIEVTSDTGTGGIVVEGILNPQNYPTDPSIIPWTGLQTAAQGGQPSFAQIAPGSTSYFTSTRTTVAATTQGTMNGTLTLVANPEFFGTNTTVNGTNRVYVSLANYNTYTTTNGLAVGDAISGTNIPGSTTIIGLQTVRINSVDYGRISMSQNCNNTGVVATLTSSKTMSTTSTSVVFFQQASWVTTGATVGTEVSDARFPGSTFVSSVSLLSYFGTSYYRVTFNQTSIGSAFVPGTTTISFLIGEPPYAKPGETIFSFIASPGTQSVLSLGTLKELTNTTLGGRGAYPNGPDVLAINVYKASGAAVNSNIILRWGEAQA